MGGSSGNSMYKIINFPLQPVSKLIGSKVSVPLSGWVTGKKSFNESLKTDGMPLERKINQWILKSIGQTKPPEGEYVPFDYKATQGMAMTGDMSKQNAIANPASTQKAGTVQQANVAQAGTQSVGFPTPVKTTFTSANTFSTPNTSGLKFGGN